MTSDSASDAASDAASVPAREERATYGDVLADRRFRLLLATRTLTIAADALRIMTLSVLVFATTGSPLLSALTFGIGFLPQLVGSFLLGSLADRARPRRLVIAGHGLQCLTAAVMGVAHLPVAAILVLLAAVAGLTPVFSGVTNRLVAETLTGDAYVLGRSLSNICASAAQLLGLAVGGAAVAFLGPRSTLLWSAGAYLIAAVAIRVRLPDLPAPNLPVPEPVPEPTPEPTPTPAPALAPEQAATEQAEPERAPRQGQRRGMGSILRHSWYGSTKLLADRRVRALLLAQWLPPMLVTGAESLIVPFVSDNRMPDGSTGLLLACLPVGMLAGDLAVGRFVRPATRERLVPALVVVLGLPLAGFALNPPWVVCAVLLLVTGTGFAYALGLQRPFLEAVPEARRGQAFGLLSAGLMSVQGVGPAVFGTVAEFTDVGMAMALAGLATAGLATVCVAGGMAGQRAGGGGR
ncbi:MFS transporter [Streptomyces sp. NBC_00872]|uniref:MFS transporter n=1 Tax=Streptomyces sp. NBC_00872 TaxID=2903686 RepID=UPI00386B6E23|nr:MFS transporter [Streptomyces sp. NBC_00872]